MTTAGMTAEVEQKLKERKLLKLDLGCGRRSQEGHVGIDLSPCVRPDFVCNLKFAPWVNAEDGELLFESGSVSGVWCSHFFEHLTGQERMGFMDEMWRVMRPGAKAYFVVPNWNCERAIMDPTHQWPPLCDKSFLYFNRRWREENKLDHYPIRCNFSHVFKLVSEDGGWDLHVSLTKEE